MDAEQPDNDSATATDPGDERREWRRIDDRLLLDYTVLTDTDGSDARSVGASDEAIHTLIAQPTFDLLARAQTPEVAALAPWLLKMDWMLELVLKTLRRMANDGLPVPQLTDVNISANGVRFRTSRPVQEGDRLALEMILPPFTPIRTTACVSRVIRGARKADDYHVAAQFVEMKPDDREALIRHILLIEAERLRARRVPPEPVS